MINSLLRHTFVCPVSIVKILDASSIYLLMSNTLLQTIKSKGS